MLIIHNVQELCDDENTEPALSSCQINIHNITYIQSNAELSHALSLACVPMYVLTNPQLFIGYLHESKLKITDECLVIVHTVSNEHLTCVCQIHELYNIHNKLYNDCMSAESTKQLQDINAALQQGPSIMLKGDASTNPEDAKQWAQAHEKDLQELSEVLKKSNAQLILDIDNHGKQPN